MSGKHIIWPRQSEDERGIPFESWKGILRILGPARRLLVNIEGTEDEDWHRAYCSNGILEEYRKYVARERRNLQQLPRGTKAWQIQARMQVFTSLVINSLMPSVVARYRRVIFWNSRL